EAAGAFARCRNALGEPVHRNEEPRPAMAGAENVPGAEDGGVQTGGADGFFAPRSRRDISVHGGRGMGDADVDEMPNVRLARDPDGFHGGTLIDINKLPRLRGT